MIKNSDLFLVYRASNGELYYQPWREVAVVGNLTDPDDGEDMELIGWTTEWVTG